MEANKGQGIESLVFVIGECSPGVAGTHRHHDSSQDDRPSSRLHVERRSSRMVVCVTSRYRLRSRIWRSQIRGTAVRRGGSRIPPSQVRIGSFPGLSMSGSIPLRGDRSSSSFERSIQDCSTISKFTEFRDDYAVYQQCKMPRFVMKCI